MAYSPRAAALLLVSAALTLACGTGMRAVSQTGTQTAASVEVAAPDPDALDKAQVAILTRAPVEARRHLTAVLAAEPEQPLALFLLANLALDEGRFDEAAALTARLQPHAPLGEATILGALIEARRTQMPWRPALVRAWDAAGRPNLSGSELLRDPSHLLGLPPGFEEKAAHATEPTQRAFLAILNPGEESATRLSALLPELTEPPIAAVVMELLRTLPPAFPGSQAHLEAVRNRAKEMAAQHPDTSQFGLLVLLSGSTGDAPFSKADLDEVERLSHLPTSPPDLLEGAYEAARRVYREAGVPLASHFAFGVATSALTHAADMDLLRHRAEATVPQLSEPERQRLLESLWRIGVATSAGNTILERLAGATLMKQAAELLQDAAKSTEASERLWETRGGYMTSHHLDWRSWPIPSLTEAFMDAHARSEFQAMRELTPGDSSWAAPQ